MQPCGDWKSIYVGVPKAGIVNVFINSQYFGMAGQHWKDQLTGRNRAKWGKIYLHADTAIQKLNRHAACADLKGMFTGEKVDIDECPGATFIWEKSENDADAMPVDAGSNRSLGAMLKARLFNVLGTVPAGDWYEIRFKFESG